MKKVIVALALVAAAATSAFAQDLSVGAGYLNSTATTTVGSTTSSSALNGAYAGVGVAMPVNKMISISSGLYYSLLGGEASGDLLGLGLVKGNSKTMEHYFNVPLNVNFGYEVAKGVKVFAFAGPTLNLGLSSTTTSTVEALGASSTTKADNYGEKSNYGRFDVLVGGGAGIQVQNIKIFGGYNYGLLDRNAADNVKLNRSEIVAGIAFCM